MSGFNTTDIPTNYLHEEVPKEVFVTDIRLHKTAKVKVTKHEMKQEAYFKIKTQTQSATDKHNTQHEERNNISFMSGSN